MPRTGKIEQHDLGPRIFHLVTREGKTASEVSRIFSAEGIEISQPTISRWLKENRENQKNRVQQIVTDHVEKVVPKDMDAIEEMENIALIYAREDEFAAADRVATAAMVTGKIDEWRDMILACPSESVESEEAEAVRARTIKRIAAQAISWAMVEKGVLRDRLAAIKAANELIVTKLRFAGVIDGAESGNIFIGEAESSEKTSSGEKTSTNVLSFGKGKK